MTAAFIVAAVALLALAIDTGRLYAAQTELQKTADLAALDAARVVGGCRADADRSADQRMQQAEAAVRQSYAVNIADDLDYDASQSTLEPARLATHNGLRLPDTHSNWDDADSVRVALTRPFPTSLLGVARSAPMRAYASARNAPFAAISGGTKLVATDGVNTRNGLLSALLGNSVSLSAVAYDGLLHSTIRVGDLLRADVAAASLDDLLSTQTSLPDAIALLADAVDLAGAGVDAGAAATLDYLAAVADPNRRVVPGDSLAIEPAAEDAAASLPLNVGQLLSSLAQAANTGAPVVLPLDLSLGPLANASVRLNIIQPAVIASGRAGRNSAGQWRTTATSAQIAAQIEVTVLGALPPALGGALVHIPLYLKAGGNEIQLKEIDCPQPLRNRPDSAVRLGVTNDIAQIGVGQFDNLASANPTPASGAVELVNAVGIAQIVTTRQIGPIALRSEAGNGSCPGHASDLCFDGTFPPQPGASPASERAEADVAASLASALDGVSRTLDQPGTLEVKVLGTCLPIVCNLTPGLLGPVVANVTSLLDPVLANVLGPTLVQPLLSLLGVSINATDASVLAVYVDQPELFSRDADTAD